MIGPGATFRRHSAAVLALILFALGAIPAAGAQAGAGQSVAGTPDDAGQAADRLTLKLAGREFLSDAGRIWSSPARLRTKDIVPLFALGVVAATLIATDESSRDTIQSYAGRHAWVGDVSPVVTQMGGLAGFAAAGAFLGAGLVFKDPRARDTGYLAASAILQSFLVDAVLKGLAGRQRPSVADGIDHWAGPEALVRRFEKGRSDLYESFPSGHSAAAFALATVVSLQYCHSFWVGATAYTLAAAVGMSRLALDKHWLSDVVIGAAIGHLVARFVVRNHARRQRLVPTLSCTRRGVILGLCYDLDPDSR